MRWARVLQVATLFVGTIIGAGFASGQEILQFFGVFGWQGLQGALLTGVAFAYLAVVVQVAAVNLRADNYRVIFECFLGPRWSKVMDVAGFGMLAGGLAVMMAGSGAVLNQQFGLPTSAGVVLLALLVSIVLLYGLTGVVAVTVVLVPIKLFLVVGVCLLAIFFGEPSIAAPSEPGAIGGWFGAAVLYVSYNMLVPLAVLSTLGRHLTVREAVVGATLGGLVVGLTTSLVACAILVHFDVVSGFEVPLLELAGLVHPYARTVISLVIWVAVFTTAVADAHGFASRLAPQDIGLYRKIGIGITMLLIPLACLPFSELISLLYPCFGYAGLILFAALVFHPMAGIWKRLTKRGIWR